PLYAIVAIAEVPLALHAGVGAARIGTAAAADVVGLQAWIPSITFVGNTPGWSVSVELFFYLACPWLMALCARRRPRTIIAAALTLAAIAAASPALASGDVATFLKCGPPLRVPEFVVGLALGQAFLRRRRPLGS